jgi:DNA-binding MarR family transcriptional regulator
MTEERQKVLTGLIEAFVRVSNKYHMISDRPLDYGTGDLLFPSEIHFLNAVQKRPEDHLTDLGDYLGITKSAASQVGIKLEKKGFCRRSHKENKKNLHIVLTDKGAAAVDSFLEYKNNHFCDLINVLDSVPGEKLETVEELFTLLESHMDLMLKSR